MGRAALSVLFLLNVVLAQEPPTKPAPNSDREKHGLHGRVKLCAEHYSLPQDDNAPAVAARKFSSVTEYTLDGRLLSQRHKNRDGSEYVTTYTYDAAGHILKIASGVAGAEPTSWTSYSYDENGRLTGTSNSAQGDGRTTFEYDENGRKKRIQTFDPKLHRSDVAIAADSVFQGLEFSGGVTPGGTIITLYNERDQETEAQIKNAAGELVMRVVRTFDKQGNIADEKQIMEHPEALFPEDVFKKASAEAGLSMEEAKAEMREELKKLFGPEQSLHSQSFTYDSQGRVKQKRRLIMGEDQTIELTYNEQGDQESEITRSVSRKNTESASTTPPMLPEYSEARYTYLYDSFGN